jgi:feruloyl esterase
MRSLVFSSALCAAAVTAFAQQPCANLTSLKLPGVTIKSATPVAAGSFELPGSPGRGGNLINVPAFCRVVAFADQEVQIELWMPEQWNKKLLAIGNGGLAGTVPYAGLVRPLLKGYAASGTDTGHQGANTNDGSWALGHYERIVNFADRGTHLMAETDKAILRAFYGNRPQHSYFNGCSQGGHEALIEAQRYPADFDGIVAGDPANYWTHHYAGGHLYSGMLMDGDGYIPSSKIQLIGDAVNEQCDALDGVKDGVLSDPRRCHFDPAKLQCKGADGPACLTGAQVNSVKKLWTGLRSREGDELYPGLVPGGEAGPGGWANWITGNEPGRSAHTNLGLPFFKYMVFDDPNWDYHTFRFDGENGFDSDLDYMDSKLGALFNAVNPNLTPFKSRGGKLIQYHGWSDPDITPLNSINYYESVVKAMAGGGNHGLRETESFYRLFMVPGMQHCAGGPGATTFDMVDALEQWVEKGVAPQKVIAEKVVNGKVERTRPLCPYPQEAVWKGSGSADDAANFSCMLVNQ